jgi:hypothetical protein
VVAEFFLVAKILALVVVAVVLYAVRKRNRDR